MQTAIIAFDSKQLSLILSKMMNNFGFETITVENTEQLRLIILKQEPALLLADWTLDEQSMLSFLSRLEKKPKTILISKESRPEKIVKALDVNIDEYIIKPFDNDILQSKLSMIGLL